MIGKSLGHYEVLEKLGAGGMGEVYRAHDTRLRRDVAIKVIPPRLLGDEEHRLRFEREARLLASLNHPHIASIYGLEQHEGQFFLVLEYVPGADLSHHIAGGALSLENSLRLARQVAEALEYAHRQGVIHRDLKPGNIALTKEGDVKVLDFGLAKALDPGVQNETANLSQSPTLLSGGTAAHVLLGTAAYMSPEQARGNAVDSRADVWAFACVVMECLTGKRLFEGDSISDTLAAVLRDAVDWSKLPPETPPSLLRLLRRCLERDPGRRLHSLADARLDLEDAAEELSRGPVAVPGAPIAKRQNFPWISWALVAVLGVALAAAWFTRGGPTPGPSPVVRFTIPVDSLETSGNCPPRISPDGSRLVYLAGGGLWVRDLSRLHAYLLPDTRDARCAFWSPDGASVGFQARGRLWRIGIDGERPVAICKTPETFGTAAGAAWSADGNIVFASGDGSIYRVSVAGGTPVSILDPEPSQDDDFHTPSLLPEGKGVIFVPHTLARGFRRIEWVREGERRVLLEYPGNVTLEFPVHAQGHILFRREQPEPGIWAVPFSLEDLRVTGDAFLVADRALVPSVSENGVLVYTGGSLLSHRMVRLDRTGEIQEELDRAGHIDDTALSPSGQKLLENTDGPNSIRVRDLVRGATSVIPSGAGMNNPFWISETTIGTVHSDSMEITAVDLERSGPPRVIFRAKGKGALQRNAGSPSVTGDGRSLLFCLFTDTKTDVWITALDGSSEARPLLHSEAQETDAQASPASDLFAYTSDESGRPEVYLSRLDPETSSPSRRWQVSSNGGEFPRWNRDGTRLYYEADGHFMEVEVLEGDAITLSPPRELFNLNSRNIQLNHGYWVDGEGRFLMIQVGDSSDAVSEIVVVQNWMTEFEKN